MSIAKALISVKKQPERKVKLRLGSRSPPKDGGEELIIETEQNEENDQILED